MVQRHRRFTKHGQSKKGRGSLSFSLLYVLPVLTVSIPVLSDTAEAQTTAGVASGVSGKAGKAKKAHSKSVAAKTTTPGTVVAQATPTATTIPAVQTKAATSDQQSVSSKVLKQAENVSAGTESNTENVTVTGSRLLQNRLTNTMATMDLGADQIQARGYTNLGLALMRENPNYSVPDNSPLGAQNGYYGAGQTYGDLLDLGSQRTLTLVNGRRFVSSATASLFGAVQGSPVDIGNIPSLLIKKVETVVGSGGPVYGSDAIAGVQNFTLDDDYQGVKLDGQTGFSQRQDAINYRLAGKVGRHFDHDRGSIVFDTEYNQTFGMTNADRANWVGAGDGRMQYVRNTAGTGYDLARGGRYYLPFTTAGVPSMSGAYYDLPNYKGQDIGTAITNSAGQPLVFSQDGKSLVPLSYGKLTGDGLTATGTKAQNNGFPISNYNNLITNQQRLNLTLLGHYDITEHLRASFEGWYVRSSVSNMAAQPYYNTQMFDDAMTDVTQGNGALPISTNNPYLTSAERTTIINNLQAAGLPTDQFYLSRANTDYYTGKYTTDTNLFRFVGGLQGDFHFAGRKFEWKGSAEYGQYRSSTTQREILTQNYINALNAVQDSSGNIVCASGYTNAAYPSLNSTCSPLNPLGVNQASKAASDYIQTDARTKSINQQWDFNADVRSTVVKLPAGDWTYDIGYEHRFEGMDFNPGNFYRGQLMSDGSYQQYGNTVPVMGVGGSYHTNEAYGETMIPLVSPQMNIPGVYALTATGSGRYVNNSANGGFWAYSGGGSYAPVRDIVFHGNYTTSFRAPSITELYMPNSTVFDTGTDPCDATAINSGPNPVARRMNCQKAGVPAGFQSNINKFTVQGLSGGNHHLKNEQSKQFTAGASFQPRWVRGLTLGADLYDVRVKDEIAQLGIEDIMAACYDSTSYPNQYCSSFSRDASGQINQGYQEGFYNIGTEHYRGLQAHLSYMMPLTVVGLSENDGAIQTTVNYKHGFIHNGSILTSQYEYLGTSSDLRDNFTANFNYLRGPLFVQWQMMYYGKAKYKLQVADGVYPNNTMKQYFMFNTTIGYTFAKRYNVSFVMNNVFDAKPQYPYQGSTNRYWDAIIGRNFQVEAGVEF
ncbi:TonB-dependent receptor domain-containing protein [Acetobacter malorum]|uniref:TonB-dependent receptor domain-containing protein n=1 Tax=Acetobacter malorum TaxID=178901 RepID=UPI0015C50285|nr:TonB-dependent receptor [Acetobacter malorum]